MAGMESSLKAADLGVEEGEGGNGNASWIGMVPERRLEAALHRFKSE